MTLVKNTIRKELKEFAKCDSILSQKCDMESVAGLEWDNVMVELKRKSPVLFTAIFSALTGTTKEE